MIRALISAVALLATLTTAAVAQNTEAIKARQGILESFGKAAKAPGLMIKGEEDFDLEKIKAALKLFQAKAGQLPALFPEDSKQGEKTEALPIIWAEKKDFEDRFPKLVAAAKEAETGITDEDTFAEMWPKVVSNCGGCHKKFRKPKE